MKEKSDFNIIFCMAIIYVILMHLFLHTNTLDDIVFSQVFSKYGGNIVQYITERYDRWSSRIFIDATLFYIGALPEVDWKILDILMILLLYKQVIYLLKNTFKVSDSVPILVVFAMCIYPFSNMGSTGACYDCKLSLGFIVGDVCNQ